MRRGIIFRRGPLRAGPVQVAQFRAAPDGLFGGSYPHVVHLPEETTQLA